MKVLWLTNLWNPYRHALWEASAGLGLDLTVVTLAPTEPGRHWAAGPAAAGRYRQLPLPARHLPAGEGRLYLVTPGQLRQLPDTDVVVLGGWESPAAWQLLGRARRRSTATVGFYGSIAASHRFAAGPVPVARRTFFRALDAVLSVGEASTEAVVAMGVAPERVVTGFNSVDGRGIAAAVAAARQSVPPAAGHRYLVVGQLLARKNVGAVLSAFGLVAGPQDSLQVVGDGPLRGELQAQAGPDPRVSFLGHQGEQGVLAAYARCHTLVLASTTEIWGLVVNEALSGGLHAVVSTRAGCLPSVAGLPGVYPAEPDPASLAEAMRRSREDWTGYLPDPPILDMGSDYQARSVRRACELALSLRAGR